MSEGLDALQLDLLDHVEAEPAKLEEHLAALRVSHTRIVRWLCSETFRAEYLARCSAHEVRQVPAVLCAVRLRALEDAETPGRPTSWAKLWIETVLGKAPQRKDAPVAPSPAPSGSSPEDVNLDIDLTDL